VERRRQVTHVVMESTGHRRNSFVDGRRQPSLGGTSRMNREVGSGRHGCESGKVKVLPPSVACFRRLACPMRALVTMRDLLGCRSHGCPVSLVRCSDRGDLGGEQTRRPVAAMLVGVLAGVNPASGTCPVATVVISGGGAGDQSVGSPEVKVLVGWGRSRSAPTGGQANQPVVTKANRSQAPKFGFPTSESEGGMLEVPRASGLVEGCVIGEETGCMQPMNFPGSQRTTG
jgi:hypothetical protein